jgi:hypothetical protein
LPATATGGPRQPELSRFPGPTARLMLIDGALKVVPDHGRMHWWGAHPKFAVMTIRAKGFAPLQRRVELSPGWG